MPQMDNILSLPTIAWGCHNFFSRAKFERKIIEVLKSEISAQQ